MYYILLIYHHRKLHTQVTIVAAYKYSVTVTRIVLVSLYQLVIFISHNHQVMNLNLFLVTRKSLHLWITVHIYVRKLLFVCVFILQCVLQGVDNERLGAMNAYIISEIHLETPKYFEIRKLGLNLSPCLSQIQWTLSLQPPVQKGHLYIKTTSKFLK